MLTDTRIRNARYNPNDYMKNRLKDGGGLHIEVRPTGAKLWRYRYRIGKDENLYALGEFGQPGADERIRRKDTEAEREQEAKRVAELAKARRDGGIFTLAEARTERDRCRGLVKQGIHPAQARKLEEVKREHEGASTFKAIAREYLEQKREKKKWEPRTYTQRERLLKREVFPSIGDLPVKQVTPAHILAILTRLEKKAPSFALMAQQVIGGIFRLAIRTLRADSDPSASSRGEIETPPTKHKTPLKAKEIPEFFKKLDAYTGSFVTKVAVRLVWLTLVRSNEAIKAKWIEFDLDDARWEIPGSRMKIRTVTEHIVPLSSQAVEWLRRLKAITGDSEFLFPNRKTKKRPAAVTLLNKAVSSMGYAGRFSPHGIRTTGSTMLNEGIRIFGGEKIQFNPDWIERQLAHHDRNETRASYNGAKYLEQRRGMMQQWADYLDSLCAGGKVVPIKARAAA